jgi:TonB family protein
MSQVSAHIDGSKQSADRRVHVRQPVRSLAYVELGEGNGGIVLNVSEGGIAVQAVMSLMGEELPCVRVQLAHCKKRIEAKGRITWTGALRKTAGVELIDLSQEARSLLREWVAMEAPNRDFVEEMTEPIENSDFAAPPQRLFESGDLRLEEEPATVSAAKAEDTPSDLIEPLEASLQTSAFRELSHFNAVHVAPVPPVSAAEPRWTAFPAMETPIVSDTVDRAPSLAVEPHIPALAARPEAFSVPPDRFGFKLTPEIKTSPVVTAALAEHRFRLSAPALVAIFAVVSLAAGWLGHGALHRPAKTTAAAISAEGDVSAGPDVSPLSAPNVSNIEVLDMNNRRWLIPMQGPMVPSRNAPLRGGNSPATQLQPDKMSSDTVLPAREPRSNPEPAASVKASPPVTPTHRSAENLLPDADSRGPSPGPPNSASISPPDQQTGTLQSGELLHRVEPVYPPSALTQNIEGTVTLYAVIDTDGSVKSLKSLDGPPALIPAALAAVRQWRYSPSLLDGHPVQTERQIKIVFQLSQSQ